MAQTSLSFGQRDGQRQGHLTGRPDNQDLLTVHAGLPPMVAPL